MRGDTKDQMETVVIQLAALGAAVVCAGVAIHEWSYASDHPYAYGPAKVIALLAIAGAVLGLTICALAHVQHKHSVAHIDGFMTIVRLMGEDAEHGVSIEHRLRMLEDAEKQVSPSGD